MTPSAKLLNPSEAASKLGISAKALRLYEERGLIVPVRTAAGWRAYDAAQMSRAAEIVALRALGMNLAEVARALDGDRRVLERVLAAHEKTLQARHRGLGRTIDQLRLLRADLARGAHLPTRQITDALRPEPGPDLSFDLPWPWDGEHFELFDIGPLNFIVGPLGSGKTCLAMKLAAAMADASFLSVDRLSDGGAAARARCDADSALNARVEQSLAAIAEGGGSPSIALFTLITTLEAGTATNWIIDVPEQGLDGPTQEALMSHWRCRGPDARALFLITRSSVILDLDCARPDEAIIFCPANHSPPQLVSPEQGAPGYEALATCLASPQVRARTEGVVAWRPATSLVASVAAVRAASAAV